MIEYFLLFFYFCFITSVQAIEWPSIKPDEKEFQIDYSSRLVSVDMPIYGIDGNQKYIFWCRGGTTEKMDEEEEKKNISFVGEFICRLNEGNKYEDGSLLSEDESAAWYSRGQIYKEEVVGDCGKYPEYGVERSFKLRNMRLTLHLLNIVPGVNNGFSKFLLHVKVESDKSASTIRAERPGYLNPKGIDCKNIRKGVEPRMCRDWMHKDNEGSWKECDKITP